LKWAPNGHLERLNDRIAEKRTFWIKAGNNVSSSSGECPVYPKAATHRVIHSVAGIDPKQIPLRKTGRRAEQEK